METVFQGPLEGLIIQSGSGGEVVLSLFAIGFFILLQKAINLLWVFTWGEGQNMNKVLNVAVIVLPIILVMMLNALGIDVMTWLYIERPIG